MSLKERAEIEKEKLKKMSGRDRLWYIWEYYKFHIAAAIVVIALLSVVGSSLYRQTFTTRLAIAIINDRSGETSHLLDLENDLKESLNCGKKDLIEINTGLYATYDDTVSQYGYATLAKISALVASKGLDVMIADQASIDHYGEIDAFDNLEELLPKDLYAKVEPFIYQAVRSDGTAVPAAISLESTRFSQVSGVTINPPYLAVVSGSPRKEAAVEMIRYLFP